MSSQQWHLDQYNAFGSAPQTNSPGHSTTSVNTVPAKRCTSTESSSRLEPFGEEAESISASYRCGSSIALAPFLYLLHFRQARYHAKHYLGSSLTLLNRLTAHANGTAAALTAALYKDRQEWVLAALFIPRDLTESIRKLEQVAKRRKNSCDYCPLCNLDWVPPKGTIPYPTPELSSLILRKD